MSQIETELNINEVFMVALKALSKLAKQILVLLVLGYSSTSLAVYPMDNEKLNTVLKSLENIPYKGGATITKENFDFFKPYSEYSVLLPVTNRSDNKYEKIKIPFFIPRNGKQNFPIVLISATIEGTTIIEKNLAYQLALRGYASAILDVNSFPYNPGKQGVEDIYKNSLKAIHTFRTFIDFIESKPKVSFLDLSEDHPIGAIGYSNGTLTVTASAAVDKRIQAVTIGGAIWDIPYIYMTSNIKKIRTFKASTMKMENLSTDQEFYDFLSRSIPSDPFHVAHLIDPKKVYQMIYDNDVSVPTYCQIGLSKNFLNQGGQVENIALDHVRGIVWSTTAGVAETVKFMNSKFGEQPVSPIIQKFDQNNVYAEKDLYKDR